MYETSSHPAPPYDPYSGRQEEMPQQFLSLRKALKVCSFALIILAFFQVPRSLLALTRADNVWDNLMGSRQQPALFEFCVQIAQKATLIGTGFLGVIVACLFLTIRSKGSLFLYVNFGVFILVGLFNAFLMDVAMEMTQVPLEVRLEQVEVAP